MIKNDIINSCITAVNLNKNVWKEVEFQDYQSNKIKTEKTLARLILEGEGYTLDDIIW